MTKFFNKKVQLAALLAALAVFWSFGAQAEDPTLLAARLKNRYQNINSFSALYERESHFVAAGSVFNSQVSGSGRLTWQRPFKLRLDQDLPKPELIVSTGQGVWWVRPERGRADIYPQQQFTGNLRPIWDALGGLGNLDEFFKVVDPLPEDRELEPDKLILVLEPHQPRNDLKRLVVAIDPNNMVLTAFRIINLVGDKTDYKFKGIIINPKLAPDTFTYHPQSYVTVVDHRIKNQSQQ